MDALLQSGDRNFDFTFTYRKLTGKIKARIQNEMRRLSHDDIWNIAYSTSQSVKCKREMYESRRTHDMNFVVPSAPRHFEMWLTFNGRDTDYKKVFNVSVQSHLFTCTIDDD